VYSPILSIHGFPLYSASCLLTRYFLSSVTSISTEKFVHFCFCNANCQHYHCTCLYRTYLATRLALASSSGHFQILSYSRGEIQATPWPLPDFGEFFSSCAIKSGSGLGISISTLINIEHNSIIIAICKDARASCKSSLSVFLSC